MATLDYSCYPHLFERVLDFADDATLITARIACKKAYNAANYRLYEHVVIAHTPTGYTFTTPVGHALPADPSWLGLCRPRSTATHPHRSNRHPDTRVTIHSRLRMKALLKCVRVVDHIMFVRGDDDDGDDNNYGRNTCYLVEEVESSYRLGKEWVHRTRPNHDFSSAIVATYSLLCYRRVIFHNLVLDSAFAGWVRAQSGFRIVFHLSYDPRHNLRDKVIDVGSWKYLGAGTCVLILHSAPIIGPLTATQVVGGWGSNGELGFLYSFVDTLVLLPGSTLTLVGAEDLPSTAIPALGGRTGESVLPDLADLLTEKFSQKVGADDAVKVECLTAQAYRERIGIKAYELETIPPARPGE
jgi:hypothetical protein